jgi:hypothetical protein
VIGLWLSIDGQPTVPVGRGAVTECRVATGGMRRTIGGRAKLM